MKPKEKKTAGHRRAMRNYGFADGMAGRPARFPDAEYQQSYRRGAEQRKGVPDFDDYSVVSPETDKGGLIGQQPY